MGKFKSLALSAAIAITANSVQATPSPAVHSNDILLHATPSSFWVLRDKIYYGPYYHGHRQTKELIKFSIWSGTVQSRCTMADLDYPANADFDGEDPPIFAAPDPDCTINTQIPDFGATALQPIQLHQENIALAFNANEQLTIDTNGTGPTVLLSPAYIKIRLGNIFAQEINDFNSGTNPVGGGVLAQPNLQDCTMASTYMDLNWIFLTLHCGYGAGDEDSLKTFIPVSQTTWSNAF